MFKSSIMKSLVVAAGSLYVAEAVQLETGTGLQISAEVEGMVAVRGKSGSTKKSGSKRAKSLKGIAAPEPTIFFEPEPTPTVFFTEPEPVAPTSFFAPTEIINPFFSPVVVQADPYMEDFSNYVAPDGIDQFLY